MSGDWIKIRCNLGDDPAVIGIAEALRLNTDEVVGKLLRLWSWADENTGDGRVRWVGARWVDDKVAKRGFAAAMQTVGWLEIDKDGITIPNFERHNGSSAKARAMDKNRKQEGRSSANSLDDNRNNVRNMSGSEPDKNRTREREEIENKNLTPGSVERDPTVEAPPPAKPRKRGTPSHPTTVPEGFSVSDRVRKWATEKGYNRLQQRLEHFVGKALAKGYTYVDWDEGFMGAIRDDWAGFNGTSTARNGATGRAQVAQEIYPDEQHNDQTRDITGEARRIG